MVLLVIGIVLVAIAVGLFLWGRASARRRDAMAAVTTTRCGDLAGAAESVCEVAGEAAPGPAGLLTSPIAEEPCVWHRSVVTEHYWDWEWRTVNGERRRERERKTRVASSHESESVFSVRDDSGTVLVDPRDARIDEARHVCDVFEPSQGGGGLSISIGPFDLNSGDDTIGFQRDEWVLAPGERLFVHGTLSTAGGTPTIRKGAGGTFVVSTRSEAEVEQSAARTATAVFVGAGVVGLVGLALVVAGLVA